MVVVVPLRPCRVLSWATTGGGGGGGGAPGRLGVVVQVVVQSLGWRLDWDEFIEAAWLSWLANEHADEAMDEATPLCTPPRCNRPSAGSDQPLQPLRR